MKKHLPVIILISIAFVGLALLLYPTISSYINSLHQSQSVAHYAEITENLGNEEIDRIKQEAKSYNISLKNSRQELITGEPVSEAYKSVLNIDENSMMGYIAIDKIGVQIGVYHGTSDTVLSNGIGHLEGSSLPLGGQGTHCVLTGHRGVPSSELFTNLDKLDVGDTFTLSVLDEVLTYEVDKISIVAPDDDSMLSIDETEDYVTLLTCTPYAVNTHRLLVRGTRIETASDKPARTITADAVMVDSNIVALFIAIPIVAIFILFIFIKGIIKKVRKYK